MDKSAESQDFFQDNNALGKRYTTTRIKPRNFLSNIAYVRINKEDYYNEKFYFDIFLLVTKNLNPFSLDRKLADKSKHEMIYMLWKECMPQKFYRHVCKEKTFSTLMVKMFCSLKVLEVITDFLKENENNYKELRNNLSSYKNMYQYVYSNVFPQIYCSTEKRGFDLKSNFHIIFKTYKDKKQLENYESIRNETCTYVDDFNKVKEKEVKGKVEKRKQKWGEVAEKNKLLKKRKQEESKVKEKEMWKRLSELNKEFNEIKKSKKDSKKVFESIIKVQFFLIVNLQNILDKV